MKSHDLIIVGAGLSGMRAALEGVRANIDVAIVTKIHPLRSHSCAAQGGINAAVDPRDSWESHAFDTVKGSDYIGDEDAIQIMAREAPIVVLEMDRMGTPFSRVEDGGIAQRAFGGANFDRTCYSADRTGQVLLHTLWEQLVKSKVPVYEECSVQKLVVDGAGHVAGVVALDIKSGEVFGIRGKGVLIATGGYGRVYASTTNATTNTGDGMAIALRAGAPLGDMEFVQFHPTGLRTSGILVTEGARGEGGYLINKDGKRFMDKYAPTKKELASRDVVSRAEQTEILEGRGVNGAIFLDLRHLGRQKIIERLPQIRELAIDLEGVDPIDNPIPVRPTNHYSMGGIRTDKLGFSPLKGLFAAGEAACVSVHGANRLGGNSLLDTIVFGKVTGAAASKYVQDQKLPEFPQGAVKEVEDMIGELLRRPDTGVKPAAVQEELSNALNSYVSVFRTAEIMQKAAEVIPVVRAKFKKISLQDTSRQFNIELVRAIELGHLIDLAESIVKGALARTESRGAHFRNDFPKRDDANWRKHTLAHWDPKKEEVVLSYEPVRTLGIPEYEPKERVY
ncbi:MAG: FAD-binding protein [Magnetococcales bacterium]|nr:FAD-binding protein [Magnetococcales bacterium]MBF0155650.1 FAD-binding protein [Magnetococcales bacterium]